jgi:hypothetical protein
MMNDNDEDCEDETFVERDEADQPNFKGLAGGDVKLKPAQDDQLITPPSNKLPDSLLKLAMPLPLVAAGHSLLPDM